MVVVDVEPRQAGHAAPRLHIESKFVWHSICTSAADKRSVCHSGKADQTPTATSCCSMFITQQAGGSLAEDNGRWASIQCTSHAYAEAIGPYIALLFPCTHIRQLATQAVVVSVYGPQAQRAPLLHTARHATPASDAQSAAQTLAASHRPACMPSMPVGALQCSAQGMDAHRRQQAGNSVAVNIDVSERRHDAPGLQQGNRKEPPACQWACGMPAASQLVGRGLSCGAGAQKLECCCSRGLLL